MIETVVLPAIIMAAGVFSAVCAIKEVPWFMNHRRAQFMVGLIGWTGTRIFYTGLGAALFVTGAVLMVTGLNQG